MRMLTALVAALVAVLTAVSLSAQTPLIDQGRAAMLRADYDAAVEILEKAVKQTPNSPEAHYFLGGAYGNKAQNSSMFGAARLASKAKEELERAVALNPKYVEARYALVEFYALAPGIMGGSFDKALEQAKAIKALDPLMGHRAYSSIYTRQKKQDLAKKEYVDAIREHPNSPKAHSWYGQYLANVEKNYTAAFAEFDTVLKIDPTYMAAWYHIGRTAALAKASLPRGEEALRKYLAHTPKENEPPLANAHYWLGEVYEKQGRKAEAKTSYQSALKLNPSLKQASEALKRVS
jgi:tetratricopeptide (TPR) repeat protein